MNFFLNRPGDWSFYLPFYCALYILLELGYHRTPFLHKSRRFPFFHVDLRENLLRDNSFAHLTSDPSTSRKLFAIIFLALSLFSINFVFYSQLDYFDRVYDLRHKRNEPISQYVAFFEDYIDWLPQMFTMLHLRSWAGAASPEPLEWTQFFWLTQQYLSGLISFSIFLLIQTRIRKMSVLATAAFIWIAMTSLSFAQCLLFVYILLVPPTRVKPRFNKYWLLIWSSSSMYFYHQSVFRLATQVSDGRFQLLLLWMLAILLAIPVAQLLLPKTRAYRIRFFSIYEAQTFLFFPTAMASLFLHLWSTWILLVGPAIHDYNPYATKLNVPPHAYEKGGLYTKFLDDPSFGAVACDVLISAVSLAIWTAVSSASLWGIIRCTLWPFVETEQIPFINYEGIRVPRTAQRLTEQQLLHDWEFMVRSVDTRVHALPFPESDAKEPPQNVAVTLVLGLIGGLGVATAGALGAGAQILDA